MSRVVRLEDVLAAVDAVREMITAMTGRYEDYHGEKVSLGQLDDVFRKFAEALGPEGDHDE